MVAPDPALLRRLIERLRRPVLLLTFAPEREGSAALLRWARERAIVLAIGHSAADAATVAWAAEEGAAMSTHLGNALPQMQPKFLNPLMAQLAEDRLAASFIADGIHIPPQALRVLLRAKGIGRSVLVTDGTAAAATPPGIYPFAGMEIEHAADGSVRVPGARMLAGSALRLDQAARNLVSWGIAGVEAAVAMASANPAGLLRPALEPRGIRLAPAVVDWSDDLHPLRVRVAGVEIDMANRPRGTLC
jgi:N-acetylglucosamine-6-phosphate deacetylase